MSCICILRFVALSYVYQQKLMSVDFVLDRFPLDLIKVTETAPLFSATEAKDVIAKAEAEGVHENEFKSGKYQLAGKLFGMEYEWQDFFISYPHNVNPSKINKNRRLACESAQYKRMVQF